MIYLKNMVSGQTVQIPRNNVLDYQPTGGSSYNAGYENGREYQKSLLTETAFTENGVYERPNGYSQVTVDVDTTSVWNEGFASGVTVGEQIGEAEGFASGITYQKSLLTSTAFTENGDFVNVNGWSGVSVAIDTAATWQNGYDAGYEDGLEGGSVEAFEEGFISGYTSGVTYQQGLLTGITITANTAITRSDGYSAITVNVPTGITGTEIPLTSTTYSADSYGVYYFVYDPSDDIPSITIEFYRNYYNQYLTFRALEDATFKFTNSLDYSLDNGETWTTLAAATFTPTVNAGSTIMWRKYYSNGSAGSFISNNRFDVEGNVMSLVYGDNFIGKTSLEGFYRPFVGLFSVCPKLRSAENLVLPATTLTGYCYENMFGGCTGMTKAPQLPATTLAANCYEYMFSACRSLTTAPQLPATTLPEGCYHLMFQNCTSLTTAPDLPATSLTNSCYNGMFCGCTSVNYIKCLATSGISSNASTYSWVEGVASAGTFVKAENANWPTGVNGIPNGWVVEDYGVDWSERYLTFVSRANNNTFTLTIPSANTSSNLTSVSYSTDNGTTWHTYSPNGTDQTITVSGISKNEKVIWKGIANAYSPDGVTGNRCHFSSTGSYEAKGNIMSLLYGDNFTGQTSLTASYTFFRMFDGVANLVSIDHLILPATNITTYCYQSMFQNCSGLTTIERFQLPATALQEMCYNGMFADCANLESGCTLPAPTLVKDCYRAMFIRTPKLRYIKCLATAGINQNTSTYSWLGNDASGRKTFVKSPDAQVSESSSGSGNTWPRSVDGIPSGWSVVDNS